MGLKSTETVIVRGDSLQDKTAGVAVAIPPFNLQLPDNLSGAAKILCCNSRKV
jgi:hypothetical protein